MTEHLAVPGEKQTCGLHPLELASPFRAGTFVLKNPGRLLVAIPPLQVVIMLQLRAHMARLPI